MDGFLGIGHSVMLGLETALTPSNLLYCLIGVIGGTFVGVLPGVGALTAISLLFPLTFYLEPTTALIMLAGIWYGTGYGGAIASILLNIPGTPAAAITALDGYPMALQGRAGTALFMSAISSFAGGSFGILMMMGFSPLIVAGASSFGSAEYFSLMVLALVSTSTITESSFCKCLAAVLIGMTVGFAGQDVYTAEARFTFGILELKDGVALSALAMGLFGVSEVIASVRGSGSRKVNARSVSFRSMIPSVADLRRSLVPAGLGSSIGAFLGAMPGAGPTMASFMAYGATKRVSSNPEKFGTGAVEGVVASESANNAAEQAAFIPTLTLGIPGSATMAIMLGVFMINGIVPGPTLVTEHPSLFWGLVMSFWVGNLMLLVLNIPLIGIWIRLLSVPYAMLYPAILMFMCVGAFAVTNSVADIWVMLAFGVVGYLMRLTGYPAAPLLLGFVLGPMMEEHFRRAMLLSGGELLTFFDRPLSAALLFISLAIASWSVLKSAVTAIAAKRRI